MWIKRSSQVAVIPGCAGGVQSHRQNHVSSEHLVSAKHSQSLHISGILIFQARKLLAAYCDFSPTVFCKEKQRERCVCELTHRGNKSHHHKATTEVQSVDLFHYFVNHGEQRQVATQAWLGSAHPSGQRHMGTQAHVGLVYPSKKRHVRTQAPFGPSLWTEAHGDTGSVGVTSPWSTAGQEEVLPQYNKKLNAHSSSQGWAFTPSPSPSRRLKHICESAVSLHRNSTSHNRQRMNNTRYNKWSFPTPILLALPVQGHLE